MKAHKNPKWFDAVQAVARGETLVSWSAKTNTPYSTAVSWSCSPEFKAAVGGIQTQVLNDTVSKLNAASSDLADALVEIARTARSDSTRLAAIESGWANLVKLESHSRLRAELNELRDAVAKLAEQHANAYESGAGPCGTEVEDSGTDSPASDSD
jgi:hypothetical protein